MSDNRENQAYFSRATKKKPDWATKSIYNREFARFEYHETEATEEEAGCWVSNGKIKYLPAWEEITPERYDEMLNVLPPEKWKQGLGKDKNISIFRMCEYYTGNITEHFICLKTQNDKYRYFSKMESILIDYSMIVKEIELQLEIESLDNFHNLIL